jgi:hypothetical protein|tara:strand:+ start:2323 stop:2508 length:186 start_codon:yes stop_codon:yes gene_type:complete
MEIQEVDQKIYIDESKFNDIQDIDEYCVELLSGMYKENPENEAYVKQLLNEFLRLRNYMRN